MSRVTDGAETCQAPMKAAIEQLIALGEEPALAYTIALTLAACEKKEVASQGPPGPPGPAGPPGGTVIRFVDGECRQTCTLACEANERILNTFQRRGASAKVVLACAQK